MFFAMPQEIFDGIAEAEVEIPRLDHIDHFPSPFGTIVRRVIDHLTL
jgi:hypothetical protein